MSTRKSHTSLPPVRTEESARKPAPAPQASVEPSPLLLRLLEVQGELATLADKGELEEVMRRITTRAQELTGRAVGQGSVTKDLREPNRWTCG